jgi:hypothetical protein
MTDTLVIIILIVCVLQFIVTVSGLLGVTWLVRAVLSMR